MVCTSVKEKPQASHRPDNSKISVFQQNWSEAVVQTNAVERQFSTLCGRQSRSNEALLLFRAELTAQALPQNTVFLYST
jgi:hypothetical protein